MQEDQKTTRASSIAGKGGSFRRRLPYLLILLSMLFWIGYVLSAPANQKRPWHQYTDHFSHYMSSILFCHAGIKVWMEPMQELASYERGEPRTNMDAYPGAFPDDMCNVEARAGKRPLTINWSNVPRPYPPGIFVASIPEAVLYEATDTSFESINRISISKYLLAAHAFFALLCLVLLRGRGQADGGSSGEESSGKGESGFWNAAVVLLLAFTYSPVVFWSLSGFYDVFHIGLLLLAIACCQTKRWSTAYLFFALAFFMHFRALWLLPLLPIAAQQCLKQYAAKGLGSRDWINLILGTVLLLLAGGALMLVKGSLWNYPLTNIANFHNLGVCPTGQL